MPRTITQRNVLALIYHLGDQPGGTHCYFPKTDMDETAEAAGWHFGRSGEAYVAVYSLHGVEDVSRGEYAGRELLSPVSRNIWILEAGSSASGKSFGQFVEEISAAPLLRRGETLEYDSPSVGKMELGWEGECLINGSPVLREEFPLIENRHVHGAYGTGRIFWRGAGSRKSLNFFA